MKEITLLHIAPTKWFIPCFSYKSHTADFLILITGKTWATALKEYTG